MSEGRRSRTSTRRATTPARPGVAGSPPGDGSGLYRLLVNSVQDYAIFALDPTGHVLSWNAGAERLKGYTAPEILGRHFSAFYPAGTSAGDAARQELEVATRDGRFEDEGWRIRKDGSRFWANVVITALRDETGELLGFAKVTRDLTERQAAQERAIADARRMAELEGVSRTKSEFLAAMSHELRTPLNAIGGYADLLDAGVYGPVTEEQRGALARIHRSQRHLLAIITDLLNYGRLESGRVTFEVKPVALDAVVDAVLAMVTPQAVARELTLEREAGTPGITGLADALKLEQIVLNLLSNAVKFTPAGGRVTVAYGAADDRVWISVRDTGPGIPADKIGSIFEPFVQLGRTLTSAQEGAGLGLAISRDLARAMAGDVTVESSPGEGARFTLTLPRA